MKQISDKYKIIFLNKRFYIILILLLFIFSSFLYFLKSYDFSDSKIIETPNKKFNISQYSNESITIPKHFEFLESTDINDTIECFDDINIPIIEGAWNLTKIELNFTDIKMEREIKNVEDNIEGENSDYLYFKNGVFFTRGLSVQMEILRPTRIYGIYIFGQHIGPEEDITFEIRGYNNLNNNPNITVYGNIELNISSAEQWYYQNFTSENIILQKGNYSLVMNGESMNTINNAFYFWKRNNTIPTTYNLHTSIFDPSGWTDGVINTTFLYKIDQKILNYTYYPKDINMTVEFNQNGTEHGVNNAVGTGKGYLQLKNLNLPNITSFFQIQYKINQSIKLSFNLSYRLMLCRKLDSQGELILKEGLINTWKIFPVFTRIGNNYTIRMDFSSSWNNITVFKDNIILLDHYQILGNILYIFNETITENDWMITANSLNRDLNIYIPKTDFFGGERLQFSVSPPVINGNLTFLLIDSLGFEAYYEEVTVLTSETTFIFDFLPKPYEGEWIILIYWQTNSEAGIQSYLIQVKIPFDPMIIVWSLSVVLIGFVTVTSSIISVKKYTKIKKYKKQKKTNQFLDILKLNYLMISERKSGLNLYERSYIGKNIDPTLISGYLNAFKIFGVELAGSYEKSQIAKLEYQKIKIIMADYKDLRLTLIFNGEPSNDFYELIDSLSYDLEDIFKEQIKSFMGDRRKFSGIEDIIDKHLNISFIFPLKIYEIKDYNYNRSQIEIIDKIKNIKKKNNIDFVFSSFLMDNQNFDLEKAEIIMNLIKNGTIKPIINNTKMK
ncbi:MAG: hypothetical protein JXA99_10135 [Candidatus Lokiarchaeota archaeon]|nr:hypothetical protein [Candidatus Lokiarchaeota archaeon]